MKDFQYIVFFEEFNILMSFSYNNPFFRGKWEESREDHENFHQQIVWHVNTL